MMMGTRNRSPFSASQWQELEHQALIFKYMVSGMPIPPDLIFTIKRSLDSSISTRFFHHQPLGWGCFQMGFGRKADPEPGRCRRTDGKKWRCSKEAFPDSKYCERHMHRGRNRSRKPVEVIAQNPPTSLISSITSSLSATTTPANIASFSLSPLSSSRPTDTQYYTNPLHPFPYAHSPSSRAPDIGLPPQNNTTNFFLDSGSYSQTDKDYRNRYFHGQREEVDEHAFFSEVSGSLKHTSCSAWESEYSRLQLQRLTDISKQQQQQQQQERHCFVLGTDFKSDRPVKVEKEPQKHLLHFLDEWPPKNRESWLPLEGDRSNSTQLSMSIPRSPRHFPISNSRTQNEY